MVLGEGRRASSTHSLSNKNILFNCSVCNSEVSCEKNDETGEGYICIPIFSKLKGLEENNEKTSTLFKQSDSLSLTNFYPEVLSCTTGDYCKTWTCVFCRKSPKLKVSDNPLVENSFLTFEQIAHNSFKGLHYDPMQHLY